MLLFFRNNTGFGGNNGLTDFKRILGYSLQDPATRLVLYVISGAALLLALPGLPLHRDEQARAHPDRHPRRRAARRASAATTPTDYKLLRLDVLGDAVRAGRRAVRARRSASSTPARCSRRTRSRWPSGWRWAGAGTLLGGVLGAWLVNGAKSWLTVAFPSAWLYFLGAPVHPGDPVPAAGPGRAAARSVRAGGARAVKRRGRARRAPTRDRGRRRRRSRPAGAAGPRSRPDGPVGRRHHRQLRRLQGARRPEPDAGRAASSAASSVPTAPARPRLMDVITGKTRPDSGQVKLVASDTELTTLSEYRDRPAGHRPQVPAAHRVPGPHRVREPGAGLPAAAGASGATCSGGSSAAAARPHRRGPGADRAGRPARRGAPGCWRTARSSGWRSACCWCRTRRCCCWTSRWPA